MDRDLVDRKLESLYRCVSRIEQKLPESREDLADDYDCQDIVAVNLERAVQLCVDLAAHLMSTAHLPLPETMADAFRALHSKGTIDAALSDRMVRAVGLRNLAVHEYSRLDWKQIHDYLPQALDDLRAFAGAVRTTSG